MLAMLGTAATNGTIGSMLVFGFLLGLRHALEADHLAAVAALATRSSSLRGLVRLATGWGVGHTLTILAVAAPAIALGATMPKGSEQLFEHLVGVVLVLLGADVVRRAVQRRVHVHAHVHAQAPAHDHEAAPAHLHFHAHDGDDSDEAAGSHRHEHGRGALRRALAMGSLHGMAGSAALLLLVLPQAGGGVAALAYLGVFGVGSIAGMLAFSMALSRPLRWVTGLGGAMVGLEGAVGVVTMLIGASIAGG